MTLVGRHIDERYRVLEQLGSGGMSVVYKALDTRMRREVAIKVLHAHLAQKPESRQRLGREAEAVAKLHHPNILEVFDCSSPDASEAYLVTEYIRGKTLREFAQAERMDPPEIAAMVVYALASALAHAHASGVIHRDLKPENVMLREDGVLKLMDFGIAKILDNDERMTMTGALVGSPAHMAPEIIEGLGAGAPADIFSLGTMLYLFAVGQLPFQAPNTTATLKRILDGRYEDPRHKLPSLSDELAEVLRRCLAQKPADRYPDAGALRDALGAYLQPLGLGRVNEELAQFFADPRAYRTQLTARLVTRLLERGQALRAEQRPGKALAALNQVLALDPDNASAIAIVDEMNRASRRDRKRRTLRRVALVSTGLLALGAASGLGVRALLRQRALAAAQAAATPAARPAVPPAPPPAVQGPGARPGDGPPAVASAPGPAAPPVRADPGSRVKPAVSRPPARPAPVGVSIAVRPFGWVQIDDGARTDERSLHQLQLPPGDHRLRVGCDSCTATDERFTVTARGDNTLNVPVTLKGALVKFAFEPPDAQVRVGEEIQTAQESMGHPFRISERRDPRKLKHQVDYEVSAPGYRTVQATAEVEPGKTTTVPGKLARQ